MELADLLMAATRLLAYLCTLLVAGCALTTMYLGAQDGGAGVGLRRRALRLALAAAALLTACRIGLLYGQTGLFFAAFEGVGAETLRTMAMETSWGAGWRIQFGAATFAFLGAALATRSGGLGLPVLAIGALGSAASVALTGHAVATGWLALALVSQAVHAVAVATWIGSLAVIFLLVVRSGDDRLISTVVERFSPLALVSAAALALSGLVTSWLYLGSLADLATTTYGRLLLLKTMGFGGVAALGRYNWRRVKPRLGDPAATRALRRAAGWELAVAAAVLTITAVLVATSLPGSES